MPHTGLETCNFVGSDFCDKILCLLIFGLFIKVAYWYHKFAYIFKLVDGAEILNWHNVVFPIHNGASIIYKKIIIFLNHFLQ